MTLTRNDPIAAPPAAIAPRRSRRTATGRTTFVLSLTWMASIVAAAVLAPLLPIRAYDDTFAEQFVPPFTTWDFLGTDAIGRSVLSRIVYGAQVSLLVALMAVAIGLTVGLVLGTLAAYFTGVTERVVDIIAASVLAFPGLVLLLALMSVLRPSTETLGLALGISLAPSFIRVVKGSAISQMGKEYVLAARAMGARAPRLMIREILPNTIVPILTLSVAAIAIAIIVEGSLSFLGFGITPPQPSWGGMIASARADAETHPSLVLVPCVVMFATVFSCNTIGDRLRTALDVRETKL